MKRLNYRGDTILEVVLAMALLTSILFTAWSITNRASQILRASSDRTKMVDSVKEQAEIIKSLWASDQSYFNVSSFPEAGTLDSNPCKGTRGPNGALSPNGGNVWHLSAGDSGITSSTVPKELDGNSKLVWVQKKTTVAAPKSYTDFYVRACWINNSGSTQKEESTQVLVRLNT